MEAQKILADTFRRISGYFQLLVSIADPKSVNAYGKSLRIRNKTTRQTLQYWLCMEQKEILQSSACVRRI